MKKRIDILLMEMGLVSTRSKTKTLIKRGIVYCNGQKVSKASQMVSQEDSFEIREAAYVSRAAYKLVHAIKQFSLSMEDKVVADIGASTGGFTQVSLINDAQKVYAVDVGHSQLSEILLDDPRVVNLEKINAKHPFSLESLVDIALVDVSFISLQLVLSNIAQLLKKDGSILALVKPQFEVGKSNISNGVVKHPRLHNRVKKQIKRYVENELKMNISKFVDSPIKGTAGNQEFFVLIN